MLKYLAPSFVIMSCAMHLFCCGIPLLLSTTSLATALGISSGSLLEIEWFEAIEKKLIVVSGAILIATFAAQVISRRLNCYEDVGCCDKPCDDKKSISTYLFIGASFLYLVNLATLIIA